MRSAYAAISGSCVMSTNGDSLLPVETLEDRHDLFRCLCVERAGGLIRQYQRRSLASARASATRLLLTSRQLVRHAASLSLQSDAGERLTGASLAFGDRQAGVNPSAG
jgi:hypothetical protein